ncbi:MAG: hypothetical protein ACO1SV_13210 [Fimbriimonas sp.]
MPADIQAVFQGQAKLHAMDFWMRYPDYFADVLLDEYDVSHNDRFLDAASKIYIQDEPNIRHLPMIRYRFGAYDRIDDALSILKARDLIRIDGRKSGDKFLEVNFQLTSAAFSLVTDITTQYPELAWYAERATLIAEIARNKGGSALKSQQYEKIEYASTTLGGVIPRVTSKVHQRLLNLEAVA